jgi:ubiquinone biosynthesis protein UbiJ
MKGLEHALGDLLAETATRATQRALSTDPAIKAKLLSLEGQAIEIRCSLPPVDWHLQVTGGELAFAHGRHPSPQVVVSGSALGLLSTLVSAKTDDSVKVDGDPQLLHQLQSIIGAFQPDIENPLSHFIGPEAASTVLGSAELGLRGLQSIAEGVERSLNNPAHSVFGQQTPFDSLSKGIEQLRAQIDRLAGKRAPPEREADT